MLLLTVRKEFLVDGTVYKLDLLFYHRGLHRLVAIDLKLGRFKPEHEGQMLLYLRYLNRNDRREGEEAPIGLILCSEGNTEHIEYLMLEEDSPVKVAQYYTKLPDKNSSPKNCNEPSPSPKSIRETRKSTIESRQNDRTKLNYLNLLVSVLYALPADKFAEIADDQYRRDYRHWDDRETQDCRRHALSSYNTCECDR